MNIKDLNYLNKIDYFKELYYDYWNISYLPNDENLRLKRLQAHHKQIELLNKLNCSIYILAQNYKKEELLNNNNIHYILFDNDIGPSNSRNELLKRFYKSSEDWMLLCDDDRYFYDYYNIYDFFSELNITSSKFLQLDYIRSIWLQNYHLRNKYMNNL